MPKCIHALKRREQAEDRRRWESSAHGKQWAAIKARVAAGEQPLNIKRPGYTLSARHWG